MGEQLKLDYYYGDEPEKFCFYRIPKVLFTKAYFEGLSTDAKVLYGLMLDMMSSSRTNRWVDSRNRVYIQFSIQRAMAYLGCGKGKAVKLFAELDTEKGIGLIERIDRGQGKADLIYVKSFEIPSEAEDNARIAMMKRKQQERTSGPTVQKLHEGDVDNGVDESVANVDNVPMPQAEVVRKSNQSENRTTFQTMQVVRKSNQSENRTTFETMQVVRKSNQSENQTTSGTIKVVRKSDRYENRPPSGPKNEPPEVRKPNPNKTNYNNNNTGSFMSSADNDMTTDYPRPVRPAYTGPADGAMDARLAYVEAIREQVRYDELTSEKPYCFERDKIDGIINIIADIAVTRPRDGIEWINSRPYSHEVVKGRLLKTDYEIITFVMDRLGKNTTKIRNMRKYLLTALYNAPDEMGMSIAAQVGYDMYGGGC